MQIGAVITQGLIGMHSSQAEMVRSASEIAAAGTVQQDNPQGGGDMANALVNMQLQSQLFDSSAKVVKVADEAIGTLLDIKV